MSPTLHFFCITIVHDMNAEVISIGDELTSGQRLDTNSKWLSERLGEFGIRVLFHTTVGDDITANVRVFREAFDRADIVLCTGGLGPTADDLTRQALADATGCELVLDQAALEHIKSLFARRKRPMPERNEIQAYFPAGARVVPNPHGSAPGIDMDIPRENRTASHVFVLPGVPAEMREMWDGTIGPELGKLLGENRRIIRHRAIKCFGVGESDLENMLPDLIRRGRRPSVGITVSRATITLRITADGPSEADCLDLMQPTIDTVHDCLGSLVFGQDEEELQHAVVRLLRERGQTLAVTEVGTGGMISQWLSEVDHMHEYFLGSFVVPNDRQMPIAALAARGQTQLESDWGLAIGRFPVADSHESAPGNFELAVVGPNGTIQKTHPFAGHPDILKPRAGKQALNLLRLALLDEIEFEPPTQSR